MSDRAALVCPAAKQETPHRKCITFNNALFSEYCATLAIFWVVGHPTCFVSTHPLMQKTPRIAKPAYVLLYMCIGTIETHRHATRQLPNPKAGLAPTENQEETNEMSHADSLGIEPNVANPVTFATYGASLPIPLLHNVRTRHKTIAACF